MIWGWIEAFIIHLFHTWGDEHPAIPATVFWCEQKQGLDLIGRCGWISNCVCSPGGAFFFAKMSCGKCPDFVVVAQRGQTFSLCCGAVDRTIHQILCPINRHILMTSITKSFGSQQEWLMIYTQESHIFSRPPKCLSIRGEGERDREVRSNIVGIMEFLSSPPSACCRVCIVGYCYDCHVWIFLVVWKTHVVQSFPSSEGSYIWPTSSETNMSVGIDFIPKPAAWATRDVATRMHQWKLKASGYHCRNQGLTKCHCNAANASCLTWFANCASVPATNTQVSSLHPCPKSCTSCFVSWDLH